MNDTNDSFMMMFHNYDDNVFHLLDDLLLHEVHAHGEQGHAEDAVGHGEDHLHGRHGVVLEP